MPAMAYLTFDGSTAGVTGRCTSATGPACAVSAAVVVGARSVVVGPDAPSSTVVVEVVDSAGGRVVADVVTVDGRDEVTGR